MKVNLKFFHNFKEKNKMCLNEGDAINLKNPFPV